MAKEKKVAEVKNTVTTEDDVMDVIRKGNLIDEEVITAGDEKDNEEEKERKIREYRRAKNKAKYQNFKALLMLRARRREEKATKVWLNDTKKLFDDLCSGKTTPAEYKELCRKSANDKEKAMDESAKQLNRELTELKDQFPGYYCWEWED